MNGLVGVKLEGRTCVCVFCLFIVLSKIRICWDWIEGGRMHTGLPGLPFFLSLQTPDNELVFLFLVDEVFHLIRSAVEWLYTNECGHGIGMQTQQWIQ